MFFNRDPSPAVKTNPCSVLSVSRTDRLGNAGQTQLFRAYKFVADEERGMDAPYRVFV